MFLALYRRGEDEPLVYSSNPFTLNAGDRYIVSCTLSIEELPGEYEVYIDDTLMCTFLVGVRGVEMPQPAASTGTSTGTGASAGSGGFGSGIWGGGSSQGSSAAQTSVANLSGAGITEILNRVNLPGPLRTLLQNNLENQVFRSAGLQAVGDYVSQTVVSAVLNVICFIACFLVCFLLMHFVLNFLKAVFRFPVLKQMNSLAGGLFGLLRGGILCFVAFALLPLIQTVVPIQGLNDLVAASSLAPIFNSDQLILAIMNGRL